MRTRRRVYVALGIKLNGDIGGRFAGSGLAGNLIATVRDVIYGWWSGPVVEMGTGFYATAGLGRAGDAIAVDVDFHGVVSAARIGLNGTVDPDDHNPPSRKTIRDVTTGYVRGGIAQLKNHGTETTCRIVTAPGRGRAADFLGRPETSVNIGSMVSYGAWTQLRAAQTPTTDDLWLLMRNDANWGIRDMRVDWAADGAVTQLGNYKRLLSFAQQPYVTPADGVPTADGQQTLRLAAGYNPTGANRHEVYLLSLNCVTGDVKDLKSGTTPQHLQLRRLPLRRVADAGAARHRRRHSPTARHAPRLSGRQVGRADGRVPRRGRPRRRDHRVRVHRRRRSAGDAHVRQDGAAPRALPRGAKFGPDGAVWHVNEANGTFTLSRNGVPVRRLKTALFRPMPAPAGGPAAVFVNEVKGYNSYLDWYGAQLLVLALEALK